MTTGIQSKVMGEWAFEVPTLDGANAQMSRWGTYVTLIGYGETAAVVQLELTICSGEDFFWTYSCSLISLQLVYKRRRIESERERVAMHPLLINLIDI